MRRARIYTILPAVWLAVSTAATAVPRLGCIYYGQVRNAFGRPCSVDDGVKLVAQHDGEELTFCEVGVAIGPGVNYMLQVNVASPGDTLEEGVVHEGDPVQLVPTVATVPQAAIGQTNVVVGQGGTSTRLDLILGEDRDGDGLPDEWEQFMLDAVGPGSGVTNITDIGPEDDFDGDGASNREEFYMGTFAFLSTDVLRIEEFSRVGTGRFRMRFLSTAGLNYELHGGTNALSDTWQVVTISTNEAVGAATTVTGDGDFLSIYVGTNTWSQFYRLFAQ